MSVDWSHRKPVLLFDSGVGGLSVLQHVRAHVPHAPIVYCADTAGFPYGLKSEDELNARVPALLGQLAERYRPCVVVIACNTASTIALEAVRQVLRIPVVGTVPAIKPAAARTQTGTIGILGTIATVRQAYVDQLIAQFAQGVHVLRHGSAGLVAMAEAKLRGLPPDPAAVQAEVSGLLAQPGAGALDTIVLACTHFPLLRAELAAAVPQPLQWVDSGDGIARRVVHWTQGLRWTDQSPGYAVFTQKDPMIEALRPTLATYGLTEVVVF